MRKLRRIALLAVMVLGFSVLAACGGGGEKYTVTFYGRDGETAIKTVEVEEGAKVEDWTPTEEGYIFIDWYATPSLKVPFPFDDPIKQDTSVFSSWKSAVFQKDEREWIIAGQSSYAGAPLNTNDWGKVEGAERDAFVLSRTAEDKNEFTLTLDLYEGDQFQIADVDVEDNYAWTNQRGYGYLDVESSEDYIKNAGNAFTEDLTKANIEMVMEGNYTITLTTDLSNPTLDKIEIERNGDPEVSLEKTYAPSLSGSITGGQAIASKDDFGDFGLTETAEGSKVFEVTISLNKGDFFSVLPFENSWDGALRTAAVDAENSDACYDTEDQSNVTLLASAKYKITVTFTEQDGEEVGTIVIKKVGEFERTEGDNEVIFTDGNTVTKAYVRDGARVPDPGDAAAQAGKLFIGWYTDLENNVPMNFSGNLTGEDQTINCVPKFISATDQDTRTVYVKGDITGWANKEEYKMTNDGKHTYTFTLEVETTAQIMFTFFEGANDTGATANGAWVDYENSTDQASGTGNITLATAGTYTITLDSFNRTVTITKA